MSSVRLLSWVLAGLILACLSRPSVVAEEHAVARGEGQTRTTAFDGVDVTMAP